MKLGIHQTGKVGIDSHFALSSSFLILYWHLLFALSSHQKERAQWDTSFLLFVVKSSSAGVGVDVFERRYHFYRRHLLGLFSNDHLDLLFDRCRSSFQNSRHSVALPCPARTLSLSEERTCDFLHWDVSGGMKTFGSFSLIHLQDKWKAYRLLSHCCLQRRQQSQLYIQHLGDVLVSDPKRRGQRWRHRLSCKKMEVRQPP